MTKHMQNGMCATLLACLLGMLAGCVSPPEQRPEALLQGERYLTQGVLAYRTDNYPLAAAEFSHALTHYQGLDHRQGILLSRINLAETALAVGNYEAATRQVAAAQPLARSENDAGQQQRLELLRSSIALKQGHYATALELLTPLLEAELADAELKRGVLANRAALALGAGDVDAADWVARFGSAVRKDESLFNARLQRFQSQLALRRGEPGEAETLLQAALDAYKAIPSRSGTAATLEEWGHQLAAQSRWDEAEDRLQRALRIRLWLLDRGSSAADLQIMAAINAAAGREDRAASLNRWAIIVAGNERVDWSALKREVLPF